jgi:YVTN family beta-propeller protein
LKRYIIPILLAATILLSTAAYNNPRTINQGQVNLNTPGNEPRSLSDIVNFTQKSNLAESQLTPLSSNWEQALRTVNRYAGTPQIYGEACAKYTCPGGTPIPNEIEIATIGVGAEPYAVGVNNATNKVFVANYASNSVSVIDGTTLSVVTSINVGGGPVGVGVNPVTNKIFVSNYVSGTVSVIDGNNLGNAPVTVNVQANPYGVGVNTVTNKIYVANAGSNTVSVIDGNNLANVPVTVNVGSGPVGVGVNPATNKIFVSNSGSGTVSVIDGNLANVPVTVNVGSSPYGVGVNPVTNKIFVANYGSNSVSMIDGNNLGNAPVTVNVGVNPFGVGVNPVTNKVYVVNFGSNSVSAIDGRTNVFVKNIEVGKNPIGVAVNPNTNQIYDTNGVDSTVSVIGQRDEVREACLQAVNPACLVVSSTGTLFPGTGNAVTVNLVAVSIRTNATGVGTQMTLTVLCDNNTSNPSQQCSAFYVDGDIWDPSRTNPGTFLVVNAAPYFYLKWHWWDFTNSLINVWGTWWYGTLPNPNWYWGVYWTWRTYVNYNIGIWLPWWWWTWNWMYYRYWSFWNTNFPT